MSERRYRLLTRSDFDGLVCAVLLKELDLIDEITFAHPKDVQDGLVEVTENDIMTNLPYAAGAHLVFDHHHSETLRNVDLADNHVLRPDSPSAARVVYEYYGGRERFPDIPLDMMIAVDQADAAQYVLEDVLRPRGWVLLNFLMDSRTGLGRFRQFRISNYQLMMQLVDMCLRYTVDEILLHPDVQERVGLYREQSELFADQLRRCGEMRGNVAVVDLRNEDIIYAGNRFLVYALYPDAQVSAQVMWGRQRQNTVIAVGKSILTPGLTTDIGALMLTYGGGGHRNAGTCQVPHDDADFVLDQVVGHLNAVSPAQQTPA